MEDINDETFSVCESLECVPLVDCPSLERIGESAFFGCTALREVILPGSVIGISEVAFQCSGVGLIDASPCPAAEFGSLTLGGSLVEKVVTSLPTCEKVSDVGAVMIEGTRCSTFVSAISVDCDKKEKSRVMDCLLSATGTPSMTLVCPAWTITSSVQVNLRGLPSISMLENGTLSVVGPSRVIAIGGKMPVFVSSVQNNILSLSLCGVQPVALSSVRLVKSVPNLRELLFPAGMTVMPSNICWKLRRLERVVFTGPPALKEIGESGFRGCCSLRSLLLPDTVTVIDRGAFAGSGIERMDLFEMSLTKASLLDMSRAQFIGFGRDVVDVKFSCAASLRLLTFGRISAEESPYIRCGDHAIEARCVSLNGRFPASFTAVLREAHILAELAAAAKRPASPPAPP
jgi:hypothetical protein